MPVDVPSAAAPAAPAAAASVPTPVAASVPTSVTASVPTSVTAPVAGARPDAAPGERRRPGEPTSGSALDVALQALRRSIGTGEFSPGQRLPSEAELGRLLGVSRSSLREAIRMLAALGVLVVRHGSGTYVSDLRAADIVSSLSLTLGLLPLEGLLEVYEMRRVLEAHATGQAAARRPDELMPELDAILTELEQVHDPATASELDSRFHTLVDEAAGNPTMTAMLTVFRRRGRNYQIFGAAGTADVKVVSDRGHRAIYRALLHRDPGAAETAAADHIAQTEAWLRLLKPLPDPPS